MFFLLTYVLNHALSMGRTYREGSIPSLPVELVALRAKAFDVFGGLSFEILDAVTHRLGPTKFVQEMHMIGNSTNHDEWGSHPAKHIAQVRMDIGTYGFVQMRKSFLGAKNQVN
jgi:hypothetical protein